jgi:hypothetical protein
MENMKLFSNEVRLPTVMSLYVSFSKEKGVFSNFYSLIFLGEKDQKHLVKLLTQKNSTYSWFSSPNLTLALHMVSHIQQNKEPTNIWLFNSANLVIV